MLREAHTRQCRIIVGLLGTFDLIGHVTALVAIFLFGEGGICVGFSIGLVNVFGFLNVLATADPLELIRHFLVQMLSALLDRGSKFGWNMDFFLNSLFKSFNKSFLHLNFIPQV